MHNFVQDSGLIFSAGRLSEDKRTTAIPCHCLELLRSKREKQESFVHMPTGLSVSIGPEWSGFSKQMQQ